MFSAALFAALSLTLSASALQIQSLNPTFKNAGIQGCISADQDINGSPLVIHNCANDPPPDVDWAANFGNSSPQQLKIFGDKCIDVKDGVNADGTKLQIWDCTEGNTNQQFVVVSNAGGLIQWVGTNKCIDLTNGAMADNTQLQIWTCGIGNTNQEWAPAQDVQSVTITAQISLNNVAIVGASNTDGASVVIARCANSAFLGQFPNGNATWAAPLALTTGTITTFGGSKCLDVKDGSTANGNRLQLWDCTEGDTNQQFTVGNSGSQIKWAGTGKCVDLLNGSGADGNPIQIWDCDTANKDTNQQWFFQ
ncbi:ricin B lectin domain-containing protein [Mycena leptocephala]|nr:ricin B lectin domain-containing protein [Mycena leptocephala]